MFKHKIAASIILALVSSETQANSLRLDYPPGCANDMKQYQYLVSRCAVNSTAWISSNVIRRNLGPDDLSRQDIMRCGDIPQWASLCGYGPGNAPPPVQQAPIQQGNGNKLVAPLPPHIADPRCIDGICYDAEAGNPREKPVGSREWARAMCLQTEPNGKRYYTAYATTESCIGEHLRLYGQKPSAEFSKEFESFPGDGSKQQGSSQQAEKRLPKEQCSTLNEYGADCVTCGPIQRGQYQWKLYCSNSCNRPIQVVRDYPEGDDGDSQIRALAKNYEIAAQPLDRPYPKVSFYCR